MCNLRITTVSTKSNHAHNYPEQPGVGMFCQWEALVGDQKGARERLLPLAPTSWLGVPIVGSGGFNIGSISIQTVQFFALILWKMPLVI